MDKDNERPNQASRPCESSRVQQPDAVRVQPTRSIVLLGECADEMQTLTAQLLLSGFSEEAVTAVPIAQASEPSWSPVARLAIVAPSAASQEHLDLYQRLQSRRGTTVMVLGTEANRDMFAGAAYLATPISVGELADAVERVVPRCGAQRRDPTPAEEKGKYEDLFHRASDAILLLDFETHRIVEANQRAVALYGYSYQELIGLSMLDLVPHEQHLAMLRNTRALAAARESLAVSDRTHIRKDGTRIRVHISAGLIEYGGKTVFQDIVRDETEWVQMEEEIRTQARALGEVNARLLHEIEERKCVETELRRLSLTDSLTQIANRRAFDERLEQEWRRSVRGHDIISVLLIDIDHFKHVNDSYGHPFGDEVIAGVARVLSENCKRAGDFVARYGGEEFAILMPNQDAATAEQNAQRLRRAVANFSFQHEGQAISVTASIGVAGFRPGQKSSRYELIKLADDALYQAKRAGRNRVIVALESGDASFESDASQQEEARLKALRALNILDSSPEECFDRLARMAKRLFDVPIALVSLVDENRQWFKSAIGISQSETSREVSFCAHAILGDETLVISDATKDDRFANNPLVTNEPSIRFYAGCPLRSLDGYKLGTLCIIDRVPRNLSEKDLDTLKDLTSIVERELLAVEMRRQ